MLTFLKEKFLAKALDYAKTLAHNVKIEKWKIWSTGTRVYVRLVVVFRDGGVTVPYVLVLQFSESGVSLVPDFDPRDEPLVKEEASDGKLVR